MENKITKPFYINTKKFSVENIKYLEKLKEERKINNKFFLPILFKQLLNDFNLEDDELIFKKLESKIKISSNELDKINLIKKKFNIKSNSDLLNFLISKNKNK